MDWNTAFKLERELPDPAASLDRSMLPAGRGVCALTDQHDRLILLFSAENLRRALWGRLSGSESASGRRADLRAVARRLWWTRTYSAFETTLEYLRAARRVRPSLYRRDLPFAPAWFTRIDPQDRFPHWQVDKKGLTGKGIDVGPFTTRKAARRFVELLEDVFDLCRYHDVLTQSPNGQPCAYKEMGKCPAPCDGSISLDLYHDAITASIDFAVGHTERRLRQLESDMNCAASRRQYELAAKLREQIHRARQTLTADLRPHCTPKDFRYLVIQKAEGVAQIKPFFIDQGNVFSDHPMKIAHATEAAKRWADKMCNALPSPPNPPSHRCEHIALVCHYLDKGDRAGGVFVHESIASKSDALLDIVIGRFNKKSSA